MLETLAGVLDGLRELVAFLVFVLLAEFSGTEKASGWWVLKKEAQSYH